VPVVYGGLIVLYDDHVPVVIMMVIMMVVLMDGHISIVSDDYRLGLHQGC
jgi:hypothetical protein